MAWKGRKTLVTGTAESYAGGPLIPLDELVNVTLASFAAMPAAAENRTITLAGEYRDVPPGPAAPQGQ